MGYRFLVSLGGVLLAAGMWAAVLVGASPAVATTDSNPGGSASSESASSAGAQADPDTADPTDPSASDERGSDEDPSSDEVGDEETSSNGSDGTAASDDASDDSDQAGADASAEGANETSAAEPSPGDHTAIPTGSAADRHDAVNVQSTAVETALPEPAAALPSARRAVADLDFTAVDDVAPDTAAAVTVDVGREPTVADDASSESEAVQPSATTFALAASDTLDLAEAAAANPPTVLDLLGTLFFNVFTLGFQLFAGPPVLPPGSTVTVRTSTLELRPGYEVPADWYVPQDAEPDRFIYFQHGFITNARTYSYTIAELAEQTNSIVVAPSITSNFFATDAMWLAGVPMREAIAELFTGNREALTASASDALGYDVTLPQRVVLFGHSYGAQAVVGAASHMDDDTIGDVAGIILLDGVSEDLTFSSLDGLPTTLPVYNLSAPDMVLTNFGALNRALANARPGVFNGFQLAGGSHVDAMQGGNPIIQLIANGLLGNRPENVEAANILIAGWVNDMFADPQEPRTGIYGAPGATVYIPTDAGVATAISVPAPTVPIGIFDRLVSAIGHFAIATFYNFEPTEGSLVLV